MPMNEDFLHFVIGSSVLITSVPILALYLSHRQLGEDVQQLHQPWLDFYLVFLPVLMGLTFTIVYRALGFVPRKIGDTFYLRFIIAGGVATFLLSILLEATVKVYSQWFEMQPDQLWTTHVTMLLVGLLLFLFVGSWLRIQFVYGSSADFKRLVLQQASQVGHSSSSGGSSNNSHGLFDRLAAASKS